MSGINEKLISQYIPDGVVLTATQKEYLTAVVELLGKQDEAGVKKSIIRLLESKDENIRMAGLDLAKGT